MTEPLLGERVVLCFRVLVSLALFSLKTMLHFKKKYFKEMESICNKLGNNILSVDGDEDGLRKAHVNI